MASGEPKINAVRWVAQRTHL